jgi:MFS superfamily sulfate permease-like transporter
MLFILRQHAKSTGLRDLTVPGATVKRFELEEQVTFLNRVGLQRKLESLEPGSRVEIDGRRCQRIDPDVLQLLEEYAQKARERHIDLRLIGLKGAT